MNINLKHIGECLVLCCLCLSITYSCDKSEQREHDIKIKELEIKQKLNC